MLTLIKEKKYRRKKIPNYNTLCLNFLYTNEYTSGLNYNSLSKTNNV